MTKARCLCTIVASLPLALGACREPAHPEAPVETVVVGKSKPGGTIPPPAPEPAPDPTPAPEPEVPFVSRSEPNDFFPPTPPMPPGCAPFDRGAAAAALGGVDVQLCARSGGPTGTGHVKVTFDLSGQISSVTVDGGPFPGTQVGACIAAKFRGARVPTFCGAPVTVGKSFSLK